MQKVLMNLNNWKTLQNPTIFKIYANKKPLGFFLKVLILINYLEIIIDGSSISAGAFSPSNSIIVGAILDNLPSFLNSTPFFVIQKLYHRGVE